MGYKLQLTENAERDLDAIFAYIMNDLSNIEAALHFAEELERRYALLAETPYLFEACHQPLLRQYRRVIIGGYLLMVRVDQDQGTVYIERFFSDLQDYATKL